MNSRQGPAPGRRPGPARRPTERGGGSFPPGKPWPTAPADPLTSSPAIGTVDPGPEHADLGRVVTVRVGDRTGRPPVRMSRCIPPGRDGLPSLSPFPTCRESRPVGPRRRAVRAGRPAAMAIPRRRARTGSSRSSRLSRFARLSGPVGRPLLRFRRCGPEAIAEGGAERAAIQHQPRRWEAGGLRELAALLER